MELLDSIDLDTGRQDFFQDVVAVLIMLVTMFGGLVAYLETDASTHADRAERLSQVYAIQAMGERLRASQRTNYDVQVYAITHDLDRRAQREMEQAGAMSRVPGMSASMDHHHDTASRWSDARDRVAQLSTLLTDMRFQADADVVRFDQYFEQSLIAARGKAEWQHAMTQQAEVWEKKARSYLAIITVLAVALFLFGLSLTIPGTVRYTLVGAGVLIAIAAGLWTGWVFARPTPEAREDAIQAYLRGVTALNMQDYDSAIGHFDTATTIDPQLGGAWADRGYARALLIDSTAVPAAIADFEEAIDLGVDNPYTRRNLGRLYVRQGDLDRAIDNFRATLEQQPDQPMVYFDLGLAQFVSGNKEAARAAYESGITLLSREPGYVREPCFQAAVDDLQDATMMGEMMGHGSEFVRLLKEASASLDMMGEMHPHDMGVTFGPVTFSVGADGLSATFDYQGMQNGLAWQDRWYVNGQRDENLGEPREPWADGASGQKTLIAVDSARLQHGTYRLEVYVEGQLVTAGETSIGDDLMASPAMTPLIRYASNHLALSVMHPTAWHLIGGGDTHDFVGFAGREDMAFFIVTARRYDTESTVDVNAVALAGELDIQQSMHPDLEGSGGFEPARVGGRDAMTSEYAFTDGDNVLRGTALAVTSDAGITYRIRMEALADAFDDYKAIFAAMLDSLTFTD